ncbi:MAG: hypothetical protein Q7J54_06000 [Candidatus Woesearchaeota archaeon]|nr:hypothetical protein [Candidatus Woesearchaeota archaeon]
MANGISVVNSVINLIRNKRDRAGSSISVDKVLEESSGNGEYPVDALRAYADEEKDKEIQICYLCRGEKRVYGFGGTPKVFLKPRHHITEYSFGLGDGKGSQWKAYWHMKDTNGKLHAVKLINDKEGNLIYQNPELPFDL